MKQFKNLLVISIISILIVSGTIIAQNYFVYTVEKGDNLSNIAKVFNTNVDNILSINKIDNPNIIITGEKLKIPVSKKTYTVQKGDTLSKIAKKLKINIKKLIKINNIKNPDKILIGKQLCIIEDNEKERKLNVSRKSTLKFIWPVHGRLSSSYGWRIHPIRKKREFHHGIDIAVPMGSPVYAAEDGVVSFSGYSQGYGNLVIIEHRRNKKTYYAHNLELIVREGELVKRGKVIAFSGNSGVSTGPHLHFEIRYYNRSENPMKYLNQKYFKNGFRV